MDQARIITCHRIVVRGVGEEEIASYYSSQPWPARWTDSHTYSVPVRIALDDGVEVTLRGSDLFLRRQGARIQTLVEALALGWCWPEGAKPEGAPEAADLPQEESTPV